MKRVLSIILMLIFTTASSGTVLSLHYCMGDLAGVSVGEKISNNCGKCGMKDKDCCHDQPIVIKIENAHAQQTPIVSCYLAAPVIPFVNQYKPVVLKPNVDRFNSDHLFIEGRPPAYVLNCVYRI